MLGTIALIALGISGFAQVHFLIALPLATIVNSFIGLHYPAGKAMALQGRGIYWQTFLYSLPIQAIFAAVVYALGYGIRLVVT
jgi:hypothetical protein